MEATIFNLQGLESGLQRENKQLFRKRLGHLQSHQDYEEPGRDCRFETCPQRKLPPNSRNI